MRRARPTALRRILPAGPVPGAKRCPAHDHGDATSNSASANKNGDLEKEPFKKAGAYLITSDLPDVASITEAELRAIEVLLGADLKNLIAGNAH